MTCILIFYEVTCYIACCEHLYSFVLSLSLTFLYQKQINKQTNKKDLKKINLMIICITSFVFKKCHFYSIFIVLKILLIVLKLEFKNKMFRSISTFFKINVLDKYGSQMRWAPVQFQKYFLLYWVTVLGILKQCCLSGWQDDNLLLKIIEFSDSR